MKLLFLGILLVLGFGSTIFVATSHKSTAARTATMPRVSMQNIVSDVSSGGQLLDVRTPAEYATGHIDGATNLSLQDIQTGTIPSFANDKPIYVYCQSGNRSSQAAKALKAAGYQKVIDLGAIAHVQSIGGVITS